MRFKIDKNLPVEVAGDLRNTGSEALTVSDQSLLGASDEVLLSTVQSEQRVFLTMDKGVADVRLHPPADYAGIVLFRPGSSGRRSVLEFVRRNLPQLLQMDFSGRLIVVSQSGIRVR